MDTIFVNSENSKTPKLNVLKLKLTNKLDLRIGEKAIALSNLSIYYTWRNIKTDTIIINLKNLHQHGMINLNYQMIRILYYSDIQDYFEYILEKHGENIDEPSVQIYVNKIENRVTFKIKNGYSLEILTPEQ